MSEPSQCAAVRRPTTRSHPSGPLPDVIPHAAEPPERGVPRPVPDPPRHRMTRGESARLASVSVTVVCAGPLDLTLARRAGSVDATGGYGPVPRTEAEVRAPVRVRKRPRRLAYRDDLWTGRSDRRVQRVGRWRMGVSLRAAPLRTSLSLGPCGTHSAPPGSRRAIAGSGPCHAASSLFRRYAGGSNRKATRRPSPQLGRDDEPAGSVPDKFDFMMARTANHTANFLVSLMR